MNVSTFKGAWQSTTVPKTVAHGRIKLTLEETDANNSAAAASSSSSSQHNATVTMTYDGSFRMHETWSVQMRWKQQESSSLQKQLVLTDSNGQLTVEIASCMARETVGHYRVNRDGITDNGTFRVEKMDQEVLDVHKEAAAAEAEGAEDKANRNENENEKASDNRQTVQSVSFYRTYHGHEVADLAKVYASLRRDGVERFIYFAGDSSLDNKYWLLQEPRVAAVNGYERILTPPISVPDVCHWLNARLASESLRAQMRLRTAAIMTSVEATTLLQRVDHGGLLAQDEFIQTHLAPNDLLMVSIGCNDIALRPTARTMAHLASLVLLPAFLMRYNPSFHYFVDLFKNKVQTYLCQLTSRQRPNKILICMIYFPCIVPDDRSWSRQLLRHCGYDRNPAHLQTMIRALFEHATRQIVVPDCEVIPIPLFDVLDATDPTHYVQRVEPSCKGGELMANVFVQHALDAENKQEQSAQ